MVCLIWTIARICENYIPTGTVLVIRVNVHSGKKFRTIYLSGFWFSDNICLITSSRFFVFRERFFRHMASGINFPFPMVYFVGYKPTFLKIIKWRLKKCGILFVKMQHFCIVCVESPLYDFIELKLST